jgi:folate-binding protein YgfZ
VTPAGVGFAAACRLVWVEGPDAEGFLQGLLTADLLGMADGEARRALLLTAKGHLLSRMRVVREAEGAYTLVADPAPAGDPAPSLQAHHVSEDLEVLGPEDAEVAVLAGVPAARAAGAGDLVLDGLVPGTLEVVTGDARAAIAALGLAEGPAADLEALRVAAGVPRVGVDTGGATLVQEAALEGWVSFAKGCYLGQETVARLHYRGHANRTLRGIALAGPAAVGAALRAGGREVGRLTSVAAGPGGAVRGLATVRHEVAPGDPVEVEGLPAPGRVVRLPFPG